MRIFFVFAALLGLLVLPCAAQTFVSSPGSFISNANPTPTTDTITVTGGPAVIQTLRIELNLSHTWDADLDIRLTPPGGTQFDLSIANGAAGDDYTGTVFTGTNDPCWAASGPISGGVPPFTGIWLPQDPVSFDALYNNSPPVVINGAWTLEITDTAAGDDGFLNSWSVSFDCLPAHQSNSATSSLSFTGTDCSPGVLPSVKLVSSGGATTMTISSPASGEQSYVLADTPGFPATAANGLGIPGMGILDLDLTGVLTSLTFVIDGLSFSNGLIDHLIGTTGTTGTRSITFNPGAGTGILGTFQAVVVDPSTGTGLQLSAATQLNFDAGAFAPATTVVAAGDDSTHQVAITALVGGALVGGGFDFYGVNYSDVFINSNGNLTFGAGDALGFAASTTAFESELPRIAAIWEDLAPDVGGVVAYEDTAGGFAVTWVDVPEFGGLGANSVRVELQPLGFVVLTYGQTTLLGGLVGISPGGTPQTPPQLPIPSNPTILVDWNMLPPSGASGGVMDPIAEDFTTTPPFDLGHDTCGGGVPVVITFVPQGTPAILGGAGYVAF